MAIVQSFRCSNGAEISVYDDDYAEISDEEIQRRQREVQECAKKIIINAEVHRISEAESEPDDGSL